MPFTQVDIISQVSIALSNGPVNDILSKAPFVVNAVAAYDLITESVIGQHNLRFATRAQKLNLTALVSILPEWKFILKLPADYLAMDRVIENVNYEIFENKLLYTNTKDLIAVYRFIPVPTLFPGYFVEFLVYSIAKHLAISTAQKESFEAVYSAERQRTLAAALFTDAQSHPNRPMADAPFIAVRRGGRRGVAAIN